MKYHDFKLIVMAALLGLASCHRQSRDVTTWTETTSKQRVNLFNLLDESSVTNSKVAPGPGRPLTFDLNKGQFGKDVDFVHAGPEAKFKLSKGKASIITRRQAPATGMGLFALAPESTEGFNVLGISFAGSNPSPSPLGLEPLPTKTNYYVGNDTSKWASGVATFQKVLYQNLYTGIDLAIYGTSTQVKYDLIVKPGADPAMIRLSFDGVVNVTKLENGDLLLLFADGRTVTHKAPVAYQGNNKESSVDSSYVLHPDDSITFAVGAYDSTKPLIIDPLIDFSTYYGQGQVTIQDPFYGDIVAGTDGMIFFTGSASTGGSGIQLVNPIDGDLTGDIDIYIAKIDTKTNTIVFSTYIGSPDREDRGNAMILDSDENIFVAGSTDSRQFTMGGDPMNPWQPQITGDVDTFVVKLTKDGLFVTSTYLGGSADDVANSLTLSSSGQIILGGFTNSQDFPLPDGGCCAYAPVQDNDAFVYSLSPDLTQLNFTKLLQGSGTERTLGLASDANGHIYATGASASPDFMGQTDDADSTFVVKFSEQIPEQTVFIKRLPPGNEGIAITADSAGNSYTVGRVMTENLPLTPDAYQTTLQNHGIYLLKLNPTGDIQYLTYLGGAKLSGSGTFPGDIELDSRGNIYVAGTIDAPTLIPNTSDISPTAPPPGNYEAADAFITVFDPSGRTVLFSAPFGGSRNDYVNGLSLSRTGQMYVSGTTVSSDFPTVNAVQSLRYGYDAFITRFTPIEVEQTPVSIPLQTISDTEPLQLDVTTFLPPASGVQYVLDSAPEGTIIDLNTGLVTWQPTPEQITGAMNSNVQQFFKVRVVNPETPDQFTTAQFFADIQTVQPPYDVSKEIGLSEAEKVCLRLNYDLQKYKTMPDQEIRWDSATSSCMLGYRTLYTEVTFSSLTVGAIIDNLIGSIVTQWIYPDSISRGEILSNLGTSNEGAPISNLPIPGSSVPILNVPPLFDFGAVNLPQKTTNLIIENSGNAALTVTLSISEGSFSLQGPLTLSISAQSSIEVPITYTPTSSQLQSGVLEISSNDPTKLTYLVQLTGSGASEPRLRIPNTFYLPETFIGQSITRNVTILNDGPIPITISGGDLSSGVYTTSFFGAVLSPGNTLEIPVTFTPLVDGQEVALATFNTSIGPQQIQIRGRGRSPYPLSQLSVPLLSHVHLTPFFENFKFIVEGNGDVAPIQQGIASGVLVPAQASLIVGHVGGTPIDLLGTKISILDHPEFGFTAPLEDGSYYFLVNSGSTLTVSVDKPGCMIMHRAINPSPAGFAHLDSVLPRSLSNSTSIQLSSSANETQVIAIQGGLAEAAAIAHLLIPPLTSLGISQKDGALVPLNNLRISASSHEKTYSGASSYPEVLSQQFIVARIFSFLSEELIVDGADALALTKKAALYTIPTIDAPVGSPIPVAVYVRSQKNWIPSLNGRVLKILRIEDGEARFDINGDDVEDGAMDLQNLGITQDEARSIASIYPDAFEKIIWRVSTDKLSDLTLAWPSDLTPAQ